MDVISNPSQPNWNKVARLMILSRELDHLEEQELAPKELIKLQFSSMGHELAQILLAQTLTHSHDAASVYYRSRPFMLAQGLTPREALAGNMARSGGLSEGRDAGVVYNMPKKDSNTGPTIFPASGDVGSQYTPAAGWAQAITYRLRVLGETDWEGAIAVALGGDGSVAANGFWSSLNIVTTMQLPMLFFIEDNGYGLSVPSTIQTPGGDIAANLASFRNLIVIDADGTQPEEAWQAIENAVQHVRAGKGPALLRMRVVRIKGHTFIDDQSYKTSDQRVSEAESDPILHMQELLLSNRMSMGDWDKIVEDARQELSLALEEVKASADPDPTQVTKHLFFNGEVQNSGGLRPENASIPVGTSTISDPADANGPRINLVDAVRRTLETEMRINPRMLVFGEDVGVKGGVHGATRGMQSHFGCERVFDTSLSEEGIIGRSVGMAFAGLLPVPEIQFRKYADPAHEQISDLGTIRWRSGNKFAAPVVVRIPVGFGKKTGDPNHSVTAEAIYAHTLGWRIAYPSNAEDAVGLLRSALRGDDPTFFFEHRALLDTAEGRRPYPGDEFYIPFGMAKQLTKGSDLTVVTWGAMVPRCLMAAEQFQGQVEILDLRTIIPWDQDAVLESIRQTGKLLVVHEDTQTGGFAGEIIATVVSKAFHFLDAPIERLATPDVPIPYNIPMMNEIIPSAERISEKMAQILAY
jgi:2-oxoisovalerate dehydrogenase E1 component